MAHTKKDKTICIRIPEKTKRLIEEEADKNMRVFQDEAMVLLSEGLNLRKFNIKNFV